MIGAIIQARSNSSRLPRKILTKWRDLTLIQIMVNRIKTAQEVDKVIIATTTSPADDEFCDLLDENHILYYRGSEADVLGRVLATAQHFKIETIVDLTGDCPLIDPHIIDSAVRFFAKEETDYVANTTITASYPRGQDVQVYTTQTLNIVNDSTQTPNDREHVSLYIYNNPQRFNIQPLPSLSFSLHPHLRLTIDYPEDLQLILRILDSLGSDCTLANINTFLTKNPKVFSINSHLSPPYINDLTRHH